MFDFHKRLGERTAFTDRPVIKIKGKGEGGEIIFTFNLVTSRGKSLRDYLPPTYLGRCDSVSKKDRSGHPRITCNSRLLRSLYLSGTLLPTSQQFPLYSRRNIKARSALITTSILPGYLQPGVVNVA